MWKWLINFIPNKKLRHKLRKYYFRHIDLSIESDTRCLLIAPHPDDEMLGMGGMLIKYTKNFDVCCVSSSGVAYGDIQAEERADIRIVEFNIVMDMLGVQNRWIFKTFGKPPFIDQINEMFQDYCAVLDILRYDYIFLPNPYDEHIEHKYITNVLAKEIIRRKGYNKDTIIGFYEVWSPLKSPNYYEDISQVVSVKKQALKLYKSQWVKYNLIPRILGLNIYRRCMANNVNYAEAFRLIPITRYLKGKL